MPPPRPPKASEAAPPPPGRDQPFDPWNSSSTGHQRAENRLAATTGWRDSRNAKLMGQFRGGASGGLRVSDKVGAGSQDYDPKARALITPEARARAKCSVADMLARPGSMKKKTAAAVVMPPASSSSGSAVVGAGPGRCVVHGDGRGPRHDYHGSAGNRGGGEGGGVTATTAEEKRPTERNEETEKEEQQQQPPPRRRGLFDGVVVYVNGSTHPLVSDHKLKHLLAEHGGRLSTHLGRRQVTHVVLGRGGSSIAGGGLAGGKLQKEIRKAGGCGVKFVGVEWVLESVKAGKRLSEARFAHVKIAAKGQRSVFGLYSNSDSDSKLKSNSNLNLNSKSAKLVSAVEAAADGKELPPPSGQGS